MFEEKLRDKTGEVGERKRDASRKVRIDTWVDSTLCNSNSTAEEGLRIKVWFRKPQGCENVSKKNHRGKGTNKPVDLKVCLIWKRLRLYNFLWKLYGQDACQVFLGWLWSNIKIKYCTNFSRYHWFTSYDTLQVLKKVNRVHFFSRFSFSQNDWLFLLPYHRCLFLNYYIIWIWANFGVALADPLLRLRWKQHGSHEEPGRPKPKEIQ